MQPDHPSFTSTANTGSPAGQHPMPTNGSIRSRRGRNMLDFDCATLDTDEISARNGTEIAGAIGYSVLRDFALTVDYRAGLVKLSRPGRN
jgi:hypothetical protein